MSGFEQQDLLKKSKPVQEAIVSSDKKKLSEFGKAGAKKLAELRDGDRIYDTYLKGKKKWRA